MENYKDIEILLFAIGLFVIPIILTTILYFIKKEYFQCKWRPGPDYINLYAIWMLMVVSMGAIIVLGTMGLTGKELIQERVNAVKETKREVIANALNVQKDKLQMDDNEEGTLKEIKMYRVKVNNETLSVFLKYEGYLKYKVVRIDKILTEVKDS
ncbi:hypothetical protein SIM22_05145 [Bacillus cereus group sp. BfR-BA-01363]|uniref:hypothetical protein n=1 Tax=Bacillus cereus group sp. BfR-BA-01363 TaxID=3094882 RepID=UPI0029C58BDA|nr:hypothetical protein [Bacillus cereus group sp. BfR-BA-01363]MDX5853518.1 hypothetical protein [Bacillus cereus group sp. BfR-BA-01363]